MARISIWMFLLTCVPSFVSAQCPWPIPTDCSNKCSICTNPMPPQTCYYCGNPATGETGFTCKVIACNNCQNRAPICQTQGGSPTIGPKVQSKCSATATKADVNLMAKENASWTGDHSIEAIFPRTAAEIIKSVQQSVSEGIPHGTAEHPAMILGKLRNVQTGESTSYRAINSGVGVWNLEIDHAIYGEAVMPLRFVMDKNGVREVKVAGPKSER